LGKRALRSRLNLLADIVLQEIVGHPKGLALRVELLLLQVVAVCAIEVAECQVRSFAE